MLNTKKFTSATLLFVSRSSIPKMRKRKSKDLLKETVTNVLMLCKEQRSRSLAMPAISTGIFQFPLRSCALIMAQSIFEYLNKIDENQRDSVAVRALSIVINDKKIATEFTDIISKKSKPDSP